MGILSYVKIGGAVVILLICGYLYWNYQHMKSTIGTLQLEITSLQTQQKVLEEKQKVYDEFMEKSRKVRSNVTTTKKRVDDAIESNDVNRVIELFNPYRMRSQGKDGNTSDGRKGSSKSLP